MSKTNDNLPCLQRALMKNNFRRTAAHKCHHRQPHVKICRPHLESEYRQVLCILLLWVRRSTGDPPLTRSTLEK